MKNNKYSFVILHYCSIDDTIRCVNSISDKCQNYNYSIIIVDNASPNNTGKQLKEMYNNDEKIYVILNPNNLGFAKGNNIGFKYSKYHLNADFIILCNNDTYLIQNNFLSLIEEEYTESNFAVLGPKILLKDNTINKIKLKLPNVKQLKKSLIDVKLNYLTSILFINKLYKYLRKKIGDFLSILKIKKKKDINKDIVNIRHENIVLHGCFLIFSREYIDKFDGLDDRTFLYMEEQLLAIRLLKNNLKSVYSPKLEIFHNEDGSTNYSNSSNRKKTMFVCKNVLKSSKIVLKELYMSENNLKNGGKNDIQI